MVKRAVKTGDEFLTVITKDGFRVDTRVIKHGIRGGIIYIGVDMEGNTKEFPKYKIQEILNRIAKRNKKK